MHHATAIAKAGAERRFSGGGVGALLPSAPAHLQPVQEQEQVRTLCVGVCLWVGVGVGVGVSALAWLCARVQVLHEQGGNFCILPVKCGGTKVVVEAPMF